MRELDKNPSVTSFRKKLLNWNSTCNKREMPWKGEKDPYKIWLSEIILQQTRVEQGLSYYLRFIKKFPDIRKLANATDKQVYKLWEGLGYYSRCSNLIQTARFIVRERQAKFPGSYQELKQLKGIGAYTAAAISSFAFNEARAVVDGNVYRSLSRIFGIKLSIDSTKGKKYFSELANELIDKKNPGIYNQAIMDFGAIVCRPVPECNICPFQSGCYAFNKKQIITLPVKKKKQQVKPRWFNYLVMIHNDKVAIRQRVQEDIWKQLYEFPMIETLNPLKEVNLREASREIIPAGKIKITEEPVSLRQILSHQVIHARFIKLTVTNKPVRSSELTWIPSDRLKDFSFPRVIRNYIHSAF